MPADWARRSPRRDFASACGRAMPRPASFSACCSCAPTSLRRRRTSSSARLASLRTSMRDTLRASPLLDARGYATRFYAMIADLYSALP